MPPTSWNKSNRTDFFGILAGGAGSALIGVSRV